jgi:SAM-dependent methyltransferase
MATCINPWQGGEAYERYVGRWSRKVALDFLAWLAVPPARRWLDIGCGTGALTTTILNTAQPAAVVGVDPSEGFLALASKEVGDPRASFLSGSATAIPIDSSSVDAVVGGLMLNFVPQPQDAVIEMARVARPGATIAVYVWDYAEGMQFMRYFWEAVTALDPASADRDEGKRFDSVCSPKSLEKLWSTAGLHQVETRPIEIPTHFRDFDDYWTPFLGGQGVGPAYVASLDPDHRDALRKHLRATLPTESDGSIRMTARVWAVRGIC